MKNSQTTVGVIGAGSFGTVVANLLAEKSKVILVASHPSAAQEIRHNQKSAGQSLDSKIDVTHDLHYMAERCQVIFPIIPSHDFYDCMVDLKPFLNKDHILIHGTKGLHLTTEISSSIRKEDLLTMTQVIEKVTGLTQTGCLAGPNLAREIAEGKPAATVVASNSQEVLDIGQQLLRSSNFQVLWNDDLYGVELCGVIKNIMAIASGALSGFELGENAKALLVNRAMVEMIHIGTHMGAGLKAFLGVAGIGDLMATCNSPKSRNFTVGYRLAKGESPQQIFTTMEETAEGVNTTRLIYHLSEHYNWKTPITKLVYKVLFEDFPVKNAIGLLMKLPVREDIDFIE
jgi:glycerol-3-phosphate dehydrogenase (NAD(P)+)